MVKVYGITGGHTDKLKQKISKLTKKPKILLSYPCDEAQLTFFDVTAAQRVANKLIKQNISFKYYVSYDFTTFYVIIKASDVKYVKEDLEFVKPEEYIENG